MKYKLFLFVLVLGTAVVPGIKAQDSDFVETPLRIVYMTGNEFTILPGLYLSRTDEVWGYELYKNSNIFLKKTAEKEFEASTWHDHKKFAESMSLNGKQGRLPSKKAVEDHWANRREKAAEIKLIDSTALILRQHGIIASEYHGLSWFSDENSFGAFTLQQTADVEKDIVLYSKGMLARFNRHWVAF